MSNEPTITYAMEANSMKDLRAIFGGFDALAFELGLNRNWLYQWHATSKGVPLKHRRKVWDLCQAHSVRLPQNFINDGFDR